MRTRSSDRLVERDEGVILVELRVGLGLELPEREPPDEEALGHEIDDEHRQARQHAGHRDGHIVVVARAEDRHAHHQGPQLVLRQQDERDEQVVPDVERVTTTSVGMAGAVSGSMMRSRTVWLAAPSRLADSMRACGTARKKLCQRLASRSPTSGTGELENCFAASRQTRR